MSVAALNCMIGFEESIPDGRTDSNWNSTQCHKDTGDVVCMRMEFSSVILDPGTSKKTPSSSNHLHLCYSLKFIHAT